MIFTKMQNENLRTILSRTKDNDEITVIKEYFNCIKKNLTFGAPLRNMIQDILQKYGYDNSIHE